MYHRGLVPSLATAARRPARRDNLAVLVSLAAAGYHRAVPELDLERAQRTAETELRALTTEDWLQFAMVAGVSLVGVWIITAWSYKGEVEEEAPAEVCELCARPIGEHEGLASVGPLSAQRLGLRAGAIICQHCAAHA